MNIAQTIIPKSDQLNADDLIAGPLTITITAVTMPGGDQPVSVSFEGDNGKPYKPCKSMRRVMVQLWGADAKKYSGRRMTLYRDEKVIFGGAPVGGIRISHMSHLDRDQSVLLTVTRSKRSPYVVRPLQDAPAKVPSALPEDKDSALAAFAEMREKLGDQAYSEILGRHQLDSITDCKSRKAVEAIYAEMMEAEKEQR